jgi:hypothetical protein
MNSVVEERVQDLNTNDITRKVKEAPPPEPIQHVQGQGSEVEVRHDH